MFKKLLLFVFLTTCLTWAQPSGRFWIGGSEGDDFNAWLQIDQNKATIQQVAEDGKPTKSSSVSMKLIEKDLYLLQGDGVEAYLRFRGDDEALMWYSGRSDLYWLLRENDTDTSALEGEWKALAGMQFLSADISDHTFTLKKDSGEQAVWKLHPVSSVHGEYRMIARPRGGESFLLYFVPIQPNMWLVRNHEENNSLFLFRGDVEDWMTKELNKRRAQSTLQTAPKKKEE